MTTIEELERRVQYVESEIEGEKLVTRRVLEQSVRNGDQLGALRSEVATARVDIQALTAGMGHLVGDVVQNTAALHNHGTLLKMLQQDVAALRSDATELRRGQEAINVRLDNVDTRLDRMESNAAAADTRLDRMESHIAAVDTRLDRMESHIAAILAAVTPRA
jgi:predicted  nucleic acid-binding Zn-ribbon protein